MGSKETKKSKSGNQRPVEAEASESVVVRMVEAEKLKLQEKLMKIA